MRCAVAAAFGTVGTVGINPPKYTATHLHTIPTMYGI